MKCRQLELGSGRRHEWRGEGMGDWDAQDQGLKGCVDVWVSLINIDVLTARCGIDVDIIVHQRDLRLGEP